MSDILKDYFYTGISFSSYFIDEGVFYCLKVEKSKFPLMKSYYLSKLRAYLKNNEETDPCLKGNERYLIYQNVVALSNASILFSNDDNQIKLYRQLKNDKEALVCEKFDIDDLTKESLDSPITVVLKNEGSKQKFNELILQAKEVKYIYLDNLRNETNREIIFDAIKVKLLQDETELYFIEKGMYANYISNCIFGLNKIAIII
ncbi:MAG: hypothetical protein E7177_00890 [Erysipelotrichaceae bacterium]|nr:hypothetical protein [Erysipelotrichaceae bacterium]